MVFEELLASSISGRGSRSSRQSSAKLSREMSKEVSLDLTSPDGADSPFAYMPSQTAKKPKSPASAIPDEFVDRLRQQVESVMKASVRLRDARRGDSTTRADSLQVAASPPGSAQGLSLKLGAASEARSFAASEADDEDLALLWDEDAEDSEEAEEEERYRREEQAFEAHERGDRLRDRAMHMLRPEAVKKVTLAIKTAALKGHTGLDLDILYKRIDKDRSGILDYDEMKVAFRSVCRITQEEVRNEELHHLCEVLDIDGTGEIHVDAVRDFAMTPEEWMTSALQEKQAKLRHDLREAKKHLRDAAHAFRTHQHDHVLTAKIREELRHAAARVETLEHQLHGTRERRPRKTPRYAIEDCSHPLEGHILERIRWKMKAIAYSGSKGYSVERLFEALDEDGSGEITFDEMRAGFWKHGIRITERRLARLFGQFDVGADGCISIDELAAFAMAPPGSPVDPTPKANKKIDLPSKRLVELIRDAAGSLQEAFAAMDVHCCGFVTLHDLKQFLEKRQIPWREVIGTQDLRAVFQAMSTSADGTLTMHDFVTCISGEGHVQHKKSANIEVGGGDFEEWPEHARRRYLLARNTAAARQQMKWFSPKPRKYFSEAAEEDPLPKKVKEKLVDRVDNGRLHEYGQKFLKKKAEKIEAIRQEHRAREVEELTLSPQLAPKTAEYIHEGYCPPGHALFEDRVRKPRIKLAPPAIEEARTCTFKPVLCKRSRNISAKVHAKDEEWHERMHKHPTLHDRLGNRTTEYVQERLDGHQFRPRITVHAQRRKPEMPFHERLHYHKSQTHPSVATAVGSQTLIPTPEETHLMTPRSAKRGFDKGAFNFTSDTGSTFAPDSARSIGFGSPRDPAVSPRSGISPRLSLRLGAASPDVLSPATPLELRGSLTPRSMDAKATAPSPQERSRAVSKATTPSPQERSREASKASTADRSRAATPPRTQAAPKPNSAAAAAERPRAVTAEVTAVATTVRIVENVSP
eukprot:TRINITY_DN55368_c0_g1_i1.p1 TRINITY_DN55368_c0_g1~~TRINITY_DN55368_c0_g1_i1.p1  ORF type:complete len:981 (-),score=242.01 TRINITY_DN55368_c0_g1_i1:204-3146(-)